MSRLAKPKIVRRTVGSTQKVESCNVKARLAKFLYWIKKKNG